MFNTEESLKEKDQNISHLDMDYSKVEEKKNKVYYLDLIKPEKKYLNDIKNYKDTLSELLQLDYKLRVDSPNKVNWELSKSKSPDG